MDYTKYFEENKKAWNSKTPIHVNSEFYNMESFKKGVTSLKHIELNELTDVKDKTLLHLQCHFGQDTLSWAREGAKVTGMDISDKAIAEAKKLAEELNIDARFICCDLYNLPKCLKEQFDVVFTSYGAIGWMPDINKWAEVVANHTKPGGTFYIAEFHPYIWMLDDDFEEVAYSYFNTEAPISEEYDGTYADKSAPIHTVTHGWNHSSGSVINALIANGFEIEFFNEFPYSPYDIFPDMVEIAVDKYITQKYGSKIPYVFSIKAKKK